MPIFTRRRIQKMLSELADRMSDEKSRDLLQRLENKRVDQALPAEMELALIWALSRMGDLDIEPEWWGGSSRPDAVTESFVLGRCVAIEIAATNDNTISGDQAMDRIALQVVDFANSIKKTTGNYLFFVFGSANTRKNGRSVRQRLAPDGYQLSENDKEAIRNWIVSGSISSEKLEIKGAGLHVTVEKRDYKQTRHHNYFNHIPPEAYSIDDNPLAYVLGRKITQLKSADADIVRIVMIADVGSTLLRRIGTFGEQNTTGYRFSGTEIIKEFISKNAKSVDAVVVITPRRKSQLWPRDDLQWAAYTFCNDSTLATSIKDSMSKLVTHLPKPRFEGYQARSLFLQGAFSPTSRGWYLGMNMTSSHDNLTVSVSARLLLDLLAHKITPQQFRYFLGDKPNETGFFAHQLNRGQTITKVEMGPRLIDSDDDYLILHFSEDPAAKDLQITKSAEE